MWRVLAPLVSRLTNKRSSDLAAAAPSRSRKERELLKLTW
jgi:hypothetical protein